MTSFTNFIKEKREWHSHMKEVKSLPSDYQFVYREIQKYLFKVGPEDLTKKNGVLDRIMTIFKEGAASRKGVLEITGRDVAAFADGMIGGEKTYSASNEELVNKKVDKSMKNWINKKANN
jgi:DNA-binding ferritin-like protein (Dps family)